jgi:anti-sigma factor ChrR (cupin superfamily)
VAQQSSLVIPNLADRAHRGDFSFEPYLPGIEIHRFYGDENSGPSAILLRYQPGARAPHHSHPGYEHIYVLSGEQADERGVYGVGTFVVNAPGSRHDVRSDTGCVVLVVKEQPVVFTEHSGA